MPPIALIFFILEELIKIEPAAARIVQDLFSSGVPSAEDWAAARDRVLQPFETLAPNSAAQIAAGVPVPVAIVQPPDVPPPVAEPVPVPSSGLSLPPFIVPSLG